MEENILKILLSHIEAVTEKNSPFVPTAINGVPQSAKEIASHFREFIDFLQSECEGFNKGWRYYKTNDFESGFLDFETTDELYNYWIKEVKK